MQCGSASIDVFANLYLHITNQCADGLDNDGNADIDSADPQCHTDGNALNAASYDPTINSEGP